MAFGRENKVVESTCGGGTECAAGGIVVGMRWVSGKGKEGAVFVNLFIGLCCR